MEVDRSWLPSRTRPRPWHESDPALVMDGYALIAFRLLTRRNRLRAGQRPVVACRPRESPKNTENEHPVDIAPGVPAVPRS